jgi:hypothetical protein
VGSLRAIYFVPLEEISGGLPHMVLRPFNDEADIDGISLLTLEKWYFAAFQQSSAEWEYAEEKVTANGILYADKISWKVAKNYTFRRIDFDSMEFRRFAVFIIDNNGHGTFFGYENFEGEKKGMIFKKKKTTGEKVTDLNFYTLSFSWESPCQAFNATYTYGPIIEPGHDGPGSPLPYPTDPPEI